MGVGYDNVDIKAAGQLGIPVCNIPDYGTEEVADHALSLILGLFRGTFSSMKRVEQGDRIQGKPYEIKILIAWLIIKPWFIFYLKIIYF